MTGARQPWNGTWVSERLGIRLLDTGNGVQPLHDLVGLALRRNPRRAHLLVSTVLGKHVPGTPQRVYRTGLALGQLVADVLAGSVDPASARVPPPDQPDQPDGPETEARPAPGEPVGAPPLVLGYAETATALGHAVADALGDAVYLHSTRRRVDGIEPAGRFEEEHSHATSHLLLPADPALLTRSGTVVLVDDELSTGRTVLNTIRELHALRPRRRYVIATLADLRAAPDRERMAQLAGDLGVAVDVVALAAGCIRLPDDASDRGARLITEQDMQRIADVLPLRTAGARRCEIGVVRVDLGWPTDLPEGGRHGFTPIHRSRLERALPTMAARLAEALSGPQVLVLGSEELMYAPLRLAAALAEHAQGLHVSFSTTTRSPVLAVDHPGYAIRTCLTFPAHDYPADGPETRYAYNVAPGSRIHSRFNDIVCVVDDVADTPALRAPGGLLDVLRRVTDRVVLVVIPAYRPAVVAPVAHRAGGTAEDAASGVCTTRGAHL